MINKDKFKNPDSIYRSAPFWSLNDKLEATELKRQINEFKDKGIGGAFLHPRGGMSTEYLSDEYFDAIRTCLEELEKLDMIGWLYDEDRFPSGTAGGKVLEENIDFSQTYIVPELTDGDTFENGTNPIAIFEIKDGCYRVIPSGKAISGEKIMCIYLKQQQKFHRFNNQSYVDVCSKEAVDCFIKLTHEKYFENFGDYFGNTVKSLFTDEPNFQPGDKKGLPWTKDFNIKFEKKFGYSLILRLPELFLNVGDFQKTRFDYWDLISGLFVESYSKNIFNWCEKKGIAYTGHLWEHTFPSPVYQGSVMPHYEYMQIPGIDMLFVSDSNSVKMYGNDFNVKEVSSVANQLGRKRVLSETHGASGWGLDFKYQKRATDWQFALGINLFCQHLSLYSMTGYRKRDFPQSFLDHQPWWKDYKILGDYMGRLSYALSQGEYQADVLVLHPSSSAWTAFATLEDDKRLKEIDESIFNLVKRLNQLQIMFDLGDDILITKYGKVTGNIFSVGNMDYKIVVLPEMDIIRGTVLKLLKEFLDNGGIIITTGKTPHLVDGSSSEELTDFFSRESIIKTGNDKKSLAGTQALMAIERIILKESAEKDISNIYGHIRRQDNKKTVFLCNLDISQDVVLKMFIEEPNYIECFDGETGKSKECQIYSNDRGYFIEITLDALNSALFLIDEEKRVKVKKQISRVPVKNVVNLDNWTVKPLDMNAWNLQFCRTSIDDGPYGKTGDVLAIDDSLKQGLGIEPGNVNMRQPWMYTDEEKNNTHRIKAEYPFIIGTLPSGSLMAAVELPRIFKVFINDNPVLPSNGFYKDRAFTLYDIKPYAKAGENIIRLESGKYGVLVNLESVYIVGDFSLSYKNGAHSIIEKTVLPTGNIVNQGYPYYSGVISYTCTTRINKEFDRAIICLENFQGVTAVVKVNDKKAGVFGWKPYSADITDYVEKGVNTITVEVSNSLQNLLGPFGKDSNQNLVTPDSFYSLKHEVFLPVGFDGKAAIAFY